MLDVAIAVLLGYCFFFILGLGVAYLLLGNPGRLLSTLCLAPTVGFALTSVVTFILVRCDFPVGGWGWLWLVSGGTASLLVFGVAWRFSRRKEEAFDWGFAGLLTSAVAFAGAVACYPMLVGDMAFTTFRGNAWDAGAYVGMAEYYKTERYSDAARYTPEELREKHPVYALRIIDGKHTPRWVTCATLAWLSSVTGVENYRLFAGQGVLCLLLAVGPMLWLARLGRIPALVAWLLAVVVVVGFWAQVVQDIAALSQLNSIALLLAAACCLTHLEQHEAPCWWGEGTLLALLTAALVLQYAEMVPLLVLATLLWFALAVWRRRAWRWDLAAAVAAMLAATALVFRADPPLYSFLHLQVSTTQQTINTHDWWRGHFPFVYRMPLHGVPGLSTLAKEPTAGLSWKHDLVARLFDNWERNLPTRILGSCFWIAALAGTGWQLMGRHENRPVNRTIGAFSFVFGLVAVYFFVRDRWWEAGKAVAFAYPFLLCVVVFVSVYFALWLWRRPGAARWLSVAVGVLLAAYLGSQLLMAKQRVHYARHATDMPNYVLVTCGEYRKLDVDATAFRSPHTPLPADATCAIAVADAWLGEYYTNVMRPRMKVEWRSPWVGEGRFLYGFNPHHVASLPEFAVVGTSFAAVLKTNGYHIAAANRDVALVDLRTADTRAPQLLLVWGPARETSDELYQTILCILAPEDGVYDLPAAVFLTTNFSEREQHYAGVTLTVSGEEGERTIGLVHQVGDHLSIPVRKGINTVRVRLWRPKL